MPVERVSSIYDIPALQAEQEKYIAFLQQSKQAIIDLNNMRITSKGADLSSFIKATEQLNQAINNSATSTQNAVKAKKQLTAAEIEVSLATQKRTASIKNDIIETKSALGSYDQLQASLKRLTAGYKAMSQQQRESAAGREVQKNILDTKNVLKSLDSQVGDHQRNVGNYAKSIGQSFANIGLRVVEYAAAYAGFNAIKGFFSDTISEALEAEKANIRFKATLDNLGRVDAFDRLTKKAKDMAAQFKFIDNDEIVGVFEKLVTYGKLSENQINELTPVIINFAAKSGISVQEASTVILQALEGNGKALKQYGISIKDAKTDTERFGIIMNDLGKKVQGAAEAFGETTTGKIAATQQHFKDLKEEIGTGLLPILNKLLEGVNGLLKGFQHMADDGIRKVIANTFKGINTYMFEGYEALKKYQKLREDINNGIRDEQGNLINTFVLPPDTIVGADKAFGGDEKKNNEDKAKARKDNLQSLKEFVSAEFKIYEIEQERKLRLYDADVKSDKNHYLDKLVALDNYTRAAKELLDRQEAEEIAAKRREAQREISGLRLKIADPDTSLNEKKRLNENIKITEKNLTQDLLLIQAEYADKNLELIENSGKTKQDIINKQHEKEKVGTKEHYDNMEDLAAKHLDKVKSDLEKKADAQMKAFEEARDIEEKYNDARFDLAEKGEQFLYSLATAGFENRLNLIQDEKDAIDKRRDSELAANEASLQSEEKKAANVAIINARAQAQKDALDRRAREIEHRKLQFERGQQIFDISISAIKAIAKLKFDAVLNPALLGLIPFILATSALSIGAILAQPLPKYKTGRGEGKEEFALVHGGEYIKRSSGIEHVSATETLTHLMPKDKVYPNKQALMKELALNSMLSNYSVNKDGGIDKTDIKDLATRIEDAVSNIKIQTTNITKEGWREQTQRLSDYDKWVQQYIKN